MLKSKQKLPKWFKGSLYTSGGEVTNPFSGESYDLTAEELSIYDFIMGCQSIFETGKYNQKMINDFDKALSWFRTNNAKAYMVLLD
tara:strand:- start:824 stop:1081 length:258 start_codon:yes stop_codon:yes gene_type:complete